MAEYRGRLGESRLLQCAEALWPLLAGPHGVMYFGKGIKGITGGYARDPIHLTTIGRNLDRAGYNVYVALNPSDALGKMRASRGDIIEWRHVLIDVDPVTPTAEVGMAMGVIAEQLPQGVSSVIHSGRGMQAWVAIDPTQLSASSRPRVERAMDGFLNSLDRLVRKYGCVVDPSCSDLPRVARLPGTHNQKTGRLARLNFVASATLAPEFVYAHERPPEPEPAIRGEIQNRANLVDVLPHLTEKACAFLIDGVGEPGRHSAAYAAAASLRELGVPLDVAERWMLRGARRCTPPLSSTDARRALRNAYQKEG